MRFKSRTLGTAAKDDSTVCSTSSHMPSYRRSGTRFGSEELGVGRVKGGLQLVQICLENFTQQVALEVPVRHARFAGVSVADNMKAAAGESLRRSSLPTS